MHHITSRPLRSWLFAPGSNARVMAKALASAADAVILDLEDAVSLSEKETARQLVAETLPGARRDQLHVRINALSTPYALDDVAACTTAGLAGIVLPKTEDAREIELLDWLLTQYERKAGLDQGKITIMPLIETAAGVAHAPAIARASPRIRQLSFGAGDFTLELGMHWSRDETELMASRNALVIASRVARIQPPVDAVWVEVADTEGMNRSAQRSRDHGFQGKLCIHPRQVVAVHDAFTPSDEDIRRAQSIVAAFDDAVAKGVAAVVVDGKMIDYPIVEIARRTLHDAVREQRPDGA